MKGEVAEGQALTRIVGGDRPLLSMTVRVIGVPPLMLLALYGSKSQRGQTRRPFAECQPACRPIPPSSWDVLRYRPLWERPTLRQRRAVRDAPDGELPM